MRCYLSINGQCIRFMHEDILDLLPLFFDKKYGDNTAFAKKKEFVKRLKEKAPLKDAKFEAFMKQFRE